MRFLAIVWLFSISIAATAQPIREYMDLQCHGTMHFPHPLFTPNLLYFSEGDTPKLSYSHTLTNVNYANYWEHNKGARIIINGAMVQEYWVTRGQARKSILAQLKYVNDFAAANADKFVVAFTPQQVRHYVATTDKTIIIHSIEGAERIVHSQEDACFWAEQGIAFMTLIHLIDNRFGGAATLPQLPTQLINFKGGIRGMFHSTTTKGLTEEGKQAIIWLTNAGIMTDITHMSPQARHDALAFMEEKSIPPISTHESFKPIQNHSRALTPEQVIQIYRIGGLVSLPISLAEYNPDPEYQARIDAIPNFCPGSIDSYKFTYEVLDSFIQANVGTLFGNGLTFKDLTEAQKELVSIGFQTDFNGWTSHARPRVGPEGCYEMVPGQAYSPIETQGLAHPGLLHDHWQWLEKEGVDLDPIKRSSERFLQLWEMFLDGRQSTVDSPRN